MSPRFLLVVGGAAGMEHLRVPAGLEIVHAQGRVTAFANGKCGSISLGESGCIIGFLFRRHGPARQVERVEPHEAEKIADSRGQALLERFWGGYVAALDGLGGARILRDPSATFPCYYAKAGDRLFLASDAELLLEAGAAGIEIDVDEIGRQLARAFVPAPPTALSGVRELLAGFALRHPGSDQQEPCWSPWDHVLGCGHSAGERDEKLSRTVGHCVASWASTCNRPLLSVSGGLDSSIVAACLAKAGTDAVCLTMFSEDPAGDERPFARALCGHLGLPLVEWPYRLDDIHIDEPLAPHLPRPRDRTQANAFERVHLEVAKEMGADAFMTGSGGDSVFGYSQSAAPVADLYLSEGLGLDMLASLLDVCRQTGCNVPDAVGQAWRMAKGSPAYRVRPELLFLDHRFASDLDPRELHHPWLDAPRETLPGKAAHIASILRAQPTIEASRGFHLPVFCPLMSQPIIESCLAIPSWEWRAGGRDRAAARSAFAADLPPQVLNRQVKGSPSGFGARLLEHFRAPIRERLLGGKLAAHGIIDTGALESTLAGERPVGHAERVRILELVNAEAWIGHWTDRLNRASLQRPPGLDRNAALLPSSGPNV